MAYGTVAPERQRKIDLITAALKARGFGHLSYDGLYPSKGEWKVRAHPTGTRIKGLNGFGATKGTFEELLATVTDDVLFAQHVHRELGYRLRVAVRDAEYDYKRQLTVYGEVAARDLRRSFGDDTPTIRDGIKTDDQVTMVREYQLALGNLRADLALYEATLPMTQEEARAYLDGLPRVEVSE